MPNHILIIDDELLICQSLQGILADEGYDVSIATNGIKAMALIEEEMPDVILLDIWMPGLDGIQILSKIKKHYPSVSVIMISGHGTIETAVKATRLGAFDFIEKPLDMDKVLLSVSNALKFSRLAEENLLLRAKNEPPFLTGLSTAIETVRQSVAKVAPTDSWVLITGENGTGKELVAHAIYRLSQRVAYPLIDVNCAAIPEELIESELFGYEKGAFTGAINRKKGKFDLAHKGTLFLDEIADMSLKTQAKILRILQEQRFERVGGTKTIAVDVRVLAATNKNLSTEIASGRFREDLFYRLNVIPIHVPPLRRRAEDIPALIDFFLIEHAAKIHMEPKRIDPETLTILAAQPWPGNVRELKNLVERLLILSPGQVITPKDLPAHMHKQSQIYSKQNSSLDMNIVLNLAGYKEAKTAFERLYLQKKLTEFVGNISQTAEAIGLERSHLHKKLKNLGIKFDRREE